MYEFRSSTEESVKYKSSKESSVYKGSEEFIEYVCDPCKIAGDYVEAQGFCTICEDYLCGTCLKSHSRSKSSRHHSLLEKDNMPRKSVTLCDPCKKACDSAEAVGYCEVCDEYMCGICLSCHARNKTSRQHKLIHRDNIPRWTEGSLASSIAQMNITKRGADPQLKIDEKYTYIRDIKVKAKTDKDDCLISGMVLVGSSALILADCSNKSLKHVDLENNVIKSSLKLLTFPDGLTAISGDKVAVVLYHQCKIQIVSVPGRLSPVFDLNTKGKCLGIQCINEKLYVTFKDPVKVQIFLMTGAVHLCKTINPDSEVLKHCILPFYVTVSPDERMIYMSDFKSNKVMCIDTNGSMLYRFHGKLDMPQDITISPFGSVYLCTSNHHVVYKMNADLSEAIVILGRGDGLNSPFAMCFNAYIPHFYVSSRNKQVKYCNFIKVYKWLV